ncbi:MAG: CoA transferase, partial [Acetivibrio sp.]
DFDNQFGRICHLIDREDLIENPRFNNFESVKNNSRPLIEELDKTFKQKNIDDWIEIFKTEDLPFDKEVIWEEILEDPQVWADDILCHVAGYPEREGMGTTRTLVRTPVKFKESGVPEYKKGPKIGEHTEEVLEKLGYTNKEIKKMKDNGAIR